VVEGSELLTTITNDAWYGWSSAAYQHWEQASLRAVEQGRYLARAANTGISGFVDPYGRVMQKSEMFQSAVLSEEVLFITSRTNLQPHRRRGGLALGRPDGGAPRRDPTQGKIRATDVGREPRSSNRGSRSSTPDSDTMSTFQPDEQLRRHQDLTRRASDLRSYL
jgi:hypothetical protein